MLTSEVVSALEEIEASLASAEKVAAVRSELERLNEVLSATQKTADSYRQEAAEKTALLRSCHAVLENLADTGSLSARGDELLEEIHAALVKRKDG